MLGLSNRTRRKRVARDHKPTATAVLLVAMILTGLWTAASHAVVIAGPDGSINTSAPNPDPGFAHVGRRGLLSGVYVRNGWVLTANHVGEGPIEIDGVLYDPVPGSGTRIENATAPHPDLMAFKLIERPALADLEIASGPRPLGEALVLIGNGRDRGPATSWTSPDGTEFFGWALETSHAVRWGTNFVEASDLFLSDTQSFASVFDDLTGPALNDPEAQAVVGDSGGAAFRWQGGTAELVGILFARSSTTEQHQTQPVDTALYQNATIFADLYFYRDQIESLIDQPDCDDGLDEDGDGLIDFPDDPGCADPFDDSERTLSLVCDNGVDDDLDGLIDFPDDDGCSDPTDPDEVPEPGLGCAIVWGSAAMAAASRRRNRA